MSRWIGSLFALLAIGSVGVAEERRPNVVFILADDLGRQDCGFMGGKEIKTPNIDKLAKAGTILDAFYARPGRSSMPCTFSPSARRRGPRF